MVEECGVGKNWEKWIGKDLGKLEIGLGTGLKCGDFV